MHLRPAGSCPDGRVNDGGHDWRARSPVFVVKYPERVIRGPDPHAQGGFVGTNGSMTRASRLTLQQPQGVHSRVWTQRPETYP